jgi:SAM-dependent methyltransferase
MSGPPRAGADSGWINGYYDREAIAAQVARGRHRDVVGGKWEQLGQLQRDFLIRHGLMPAHRLLDVGCGAFRGGVHFVAYLDPGNYYGIDVSPALLDVGYAQEIAAQGLADRLPRANLACNGEFDIPWDVPFEYAIAQSLFTHLPLNQIRYCLARVAPAMHPGGQFFATYHAVGETEDAMQPRDNKGRITYPTRDPYHYKFGDLAFAASELPWRIESVADDEWPHPRQKIVRFERR